MQRDELLGLWNAMETDGNWIPAWTDSLRGLSAADAAWLPGPNAHSVWQEVAHLIFWRRVTLGYSQGKPAPTEEEIREEFAAPAPDSPEATEANWAAAVAALHETQDAIRAALENDTAPVDLERVQYHILHDAYHLGRITLIRAMRGTPPPF